MERSEFTALPVGVALGLLFDANPGLARVPAPELTRPPRYDGKLFRKGGFVWMSETELASLKWWREKKQESANSGSQYAARDAKDVATLDKWIAWREQSPTECWSGTRGDESVMAAAPSRSPVLRENTRRGPAPPPDYEPEPMPADDGEIPF